MTLIASKGHFFTHMPQPMHSGSERYAILLLGPTSMQSLPSFTTGHDFLHSWPHFLGLHRSALMMAMRVRASPGESASLVNFFFGGIVFYFIYLYYCFLSCIVGCACTCCCHDW